jgi:hypothetical protein
LHRHCKPMLFLRRLCETADFKSFASAIPPLGRAVAISSSAFHNSVPNQYSYIPDLRNRTNSQNILVVMQHPFLQYLESSLTNIAPRLAVELRGDWSEKFRRTYESKTQLGTGGGPYVDVVDRWWRGTLNCSSEISGIAFLLTEQCVYWVKSPVASLTLPVDVSLHAYANYIRQHATFTAQLGGAGLPGVPVLIEDNVAGVCRVEPNTFTTCQAACLAQTSTTIFAVLLFPRMLFKFGRNRLWHLHNEIASSLPPDIGKLLTRQRAGNIPTSIC